MPEAIAEAEQPAPVVAREHVLVLVQVRDVGKRGGQPQLVGRAQAGADGVLDVTQAAREGQLLLVVERLVVEDQHRVAVHAGVDLRDLLGGERAGQVETVDLGGEAGPDLAKRDAHRGASWRFGRHCSPAGTRRA